MWLFKRILFDIQKFFQRSCFLVKRVFLSLTKKEKRILILLCILFIAALWGRIYQLLITNKPTGPTEGGVYKEVSFGEIDSFNPFFADSRIEKDVAGIIFLNLVDYDDKGEIKGVLIDKFVFSKNKAELKFKDNLYWHDGVPLSTDDFIFTIKIFKEVKSLSLWGNIWKDVKIEKLSDKKIKLEFNENSLSPKNLCFPILPSHLLKDKDINKIQGFSFNLNPIGNGPFKFKKIRYLVSGEKVVVLERFTKFPKTPRLSSIEITAEVDQDRALWKYKNYPFSGVSQVPLEKVEEISNAKNELHRIYFPQYTALFYNLKRKKFEDLEVRKALDMAIDRKNIYKTFSLAKPTSLPLPGGAKKEEVYYNPKQSKKILSSKNLELELSFVNKNIYELTAKEVAKNWGEVGVKVKLAPLDEASLSQKIFSKDFDVVLWSETIGGEWVLDRWTSSSQLNFSGFSFEDIDEKILEAHTKEEKIKVAEAIKEKYPASFLFSIPYVWSTRNIEGLPLNMMGEDPTNRFGNIEDWYLSSLK